MTKPARSTIAARGSLGLVLALASLGASQPYDADVGPAAPDVHPLAPSVKALKTIALGGYEVWAHPIVQKGHLFYADAPKLTGGDGEIDMGEIEGTFKPSAEKKRRYAVRVMERDDGGKKVRAIVPIRP